MLEFNPELDDLEDDLGAFSGQQELRSDAPPPENQELRIGDGSGNKNPGEVSQNDIKFTDSDLRVDREFEARLKHKLGHF